MNWIKRKAFELWKDDFWDWFREDKPITHKDLDFAYTDNKGRRYYKFKDNQGFPLKRQAKREEYLMWHTRNLTQEQLDDLLGEIDNAAQEGLKDPKNVSRVMSIVNEIKFRREQIISFDILLNIAAIAWIREDEDPTDFSQP